MVEFQTKRILFHLIVLILGKASSESDLIEGICSGKVSSAGSRGSRSPSVYPLRFVACKTGQLVWIDPYGGVQITFQSSVPIATEGTYQVCLTARIAGINIFLRNGKTFKTLRRYDDKNTTSEICVSSDTKHTLIYFESAVKMKAKSAVITYRTLFARKGKGPLRPKECKPCKPQELIKSFCGSDFVVHGNVKSVIPISAGHERGEAVVVAKKVLRQTVNIFEKARDSDEITGNVNFPVKCHWRKHTRHGYLFTGNLKNGDGPVIQCRVKFHLWKRLYYPNICDNVMVQT